MQPGIRVAFRDEAGIKKLDSLWSNVSVDVCCFFVNGKYHHNNFPSSFRGLRLSSPSSVVIAEATKVSYVHYHLPISIGLNLTVSPIPDPLSEEEVTVSRPPPNYLGKSCTF